MKQVFIFFILVVFHPIATAEPPTWAQAATVAKNADNHRQLEKIYQRALKAEPDNHKIKFELARTYEAKGRLKESLDLAQQLRDSGAANAETLLLIGRLEARKQNWLAARDSYQQAIRLEPANTGAYLGLGQALQQLGDEESADREYDQYQSLINLKSE